MKIVLSQLFPDL